MAAVGKARSVGRISASHDKMDMHSSRHSARNPPAGSALLATTFIEVGGIRCECSAQLFRPTFLRFANPLYADYK